MISYEDLKISEKRTIDKALDMQGGYVLDFSNRTIEEHFEDEFGIDFYSDQFSGNGDSKAKRLRTILASLEGPKAALVLKNLWEVRSTLPLYGGASEPTQEDNLRNAYFNIVGRLEGDSPAIDLKAFENFDASDTLHSLLQSIERDIRDDAPESAIDRLHLFCVKRFSSVRKSCWSVSQDYVSTAHI